MTAIPATLPHYRFANGPKGLHFLKAIFDFYTNPIRMFAEMHEQYGDIVRLEGLGYTAHLISLPEHIKYVLQDNNKNYHLSGVFDETTPLLGRGLTTNNGAYWLRQRRMVQSAFHRQFIAAFGETIAATVDKVFVPKLLEAASNRRPVEIESAILHVNHRILGRLLFSHDFGEGDPFLKAFATYREISINRVRSLISLPASKRFGQAVKTLDDFAYAQIRQRREQPDEERFDLLGLLMAARDEDTGEGMTDKELHDEIMTLFFAAFEDVANTVAWGWYLLSQNPDAEARLYAEIDSVLGDRQPTAADLRNLPYLSMTVSEIMRLYPATWSMLRDVVADDEIGGYVIPKGSTIIFNSLLTHRLPQFWEEPERFDPERFSPERSAGRPRYAYIPFGGGPRQCVGSELALMEIRMLLARMVQVFRFTRASEKPVEMEALSSLRPRGGVWMNLQTRQTDL